jgi:hypothetical protein
MGSPRVVAGQHGIPVARDPPPRDLQPDEPLLRTVLRDPRQRLAPHEVARLLQLHDAPEAGVEGVGVAIELVAVERHPGLEAERVARPQPGGHDTGIPAGGGERLPDLGAAPPVHEHLEAVLAGVARPRDERRHARDLALGDGVVLEPVQVDVGQRRQDLRGAGPLDRDQRGGQGPVVEDGLPAIEPMGQLVRHHRGVAGVRDHQEPLRPEPVDDQVVDHAAVGGDDHRVLGATHGERPGVRDQGRGQRITGVVALDEQLAHVRQVEQRGALPDRLVLLQDPGVLDRHEPAAELDEACARRAMDLDERGLVELLARDRLRGAGGLGHGRVSTVASSRTRSAVAATSSRSVAKLRSPGASSNGTHRTRSNSASWRDRSPPTGCIRK